MVGLERGKVKLKDHQQSWQTAYKKEVSRIKSFLGSEIKEFQHIGSTSIQGALAKPVIDMIAVIENLDNSHHIVSKLEDNGYEHRPNGDLEDRIFLAKGPKENRTHYLSLTEDGSNFYRRTTAFRDYLNNNPEEVEKYNELKQDLEEKYSDREKYTEGKREFIDRITKKALK